MTLDGEPIEEGMIEFRPAGGNTGPVAGSSIRDGEYATDEPKGPVVGLNAIAINARKITGRKVQAPPPSPPGTMVDEIVEAVPARYNVETELSKEIAPGDNVFDFDLTSK